MKSKKIKVFIDGEVLVLDHFSGIGHYTAEILREVDKLLDTKEFSNIDAEIGLPWKLKHRVKKFDYKNFKFKSMPFSPRVANALKRKGWIPPIDLLFGKKVYIFTHFSSWPTLRSPQIPIIYDLSFIHFPQYSAEKNQRFLVKQTELSAKRASRIITISENSKNEISDHYKTPKDNIDVVTPVLDTTKFKPQSKNNIKKIKAKYGLFYDYVLFVGNIEPRKNLVSLLKAYRKLPKKVQDNFALLLVGAKGWKDKEIHNLINDMKDEGLKILQPQSYVSDEDLPALYSGARAFAYISIYEGYGIPPTEAMACGTATITSNNSSLPEAVEDASIMVDALNIQQITNALNKVLSDNNENDKLTKKGFERVNRLNAKKSARVFLDSIIMTSKKENNNE
ncbi:MAG: glycosyltransferase family 1 protein [Candidatus Saccharibacteria bacterium]|nr:glycosyltransferase family 1 protein [Candidatus Saccharibacteria bacterium]